MRIETYTIGIEIDQQIDKALSSADKSIREMADRTDSAFKDVGRKIQSSLESVRLPALVVAGGGVTAFRGLVDGASDAVESINAVNVVFGEASDQILQFSKVADTTVALSAKSFNQLAVNTGALLKDTGISSQELGDTTLELTQRAADLASVFNTDVNDAMSAINQAIRGETEAIRRYAGDVTDATLETFLMSEGIDKSVKDLTQQEKRLFRVKLLLSQTSVAQGDFANTMQSTANQAKIQGAQLENMADSFGEKLLPVMESIQRVTGSIINVFAGMSDRTQDVVVKVGLAVTAISALLVGLSFVAPVVTSIVTAVIGLGKILRLVFITNPIGLAISGIIAALVLLWDAFNGGDIILNKIYNWFTEKFPAATEILKSAFQSLSDFIQSVFEKITNSFNFILSLPDKISSAFSNISSVLSLPDKISGTFSNLSSGLSSAVDRGVDFFRNQDSGNQLGQANTNNTTNNTVIDNIEVKSSAESVNALVEDIGSGITEGQPLPAFAP